MAICDFDRISVYKCAHSTLGQTSHSEHMSEKKLPEAGPRPEAVGTAVGCSTNDSLGQSYVGEH